MDRHKPPVWRYVCTFYSASENTIYVDTYTPILVQNEKQKMTNVMLIDR